MPGENHRASESASPSPDERYEEFAKENERWNEKIDEALDELDRLMPDSHGALSGQRADASITGA